MSTLRDAIDSAIEPARRTDHAFGLLITLGGDVCNVGCGDEK